MGALLAFHGESRLSTSALASALTDSASALASALTGRLRAAASGHGDAVMALKCVAALKDLLACGVCVLREHILGALVRHPTRSHSFPLGHSLDAASWVGFFVACLPEVVPLASAPEALLHVTSSQTRREKRVGIRRGGAARCAGGGLLDGEKTNHGPKFLTGDSTSDQAWGLRAATWVQYLGQEELREGGR